MVDRSYREQYLDAVSTYLRDQEVAGLDIVTDGDCRFDADVARPQLVFLRAAAHERLLRRELLPRRRQGGLSAQAGAHPARRARDAHDAGPHRAGRARHAAVHRGLEGGAAARPRSR